MEVDLEVSKEVEVEEDDITRLKDRLRDGATLCVSCACQLVSEKMKRWFDFVNHFLDDDERWRWLRSKNPTASNLSH